MQKGVLRNFTKFTWKTPAPESLFLKKRDSGTCVFQVNFVKFLKTPLDDCFYTFRQHANHTYD